MLRLQADQPFPAAIRRGDWAELDLSLRNESNVPATIPPTAHVQVGVTLLRHDYRSVTGVPVFAVQVRTAGKVTGPTPKGRADRHAAASGAAAFNRRGTDGTTSAELVFDRFGHLPFKFKILLTCTREHYTTNAHTPTCLHRIVRPLFLRFTVIKSSWAEHPPSSVLPVTLGPFSVVDKPVDGAVGPTASAAKASPASAAKLATEAVQQRVHAFSFGELVTYERPTAVLDGFGHVVWDAAFLLLRWLQALPTSLLMGRRVVELGSGVGLVGMGAACLGGHVTLTDMPNVLALTQQNVDANTRVIRARGGKAEILPLQWGDSTHLDQLQASLGGRLPDVILASDVVYQNALFQPLISTLARLAGRETVVLLAARQRHGCDFEEFLNQLAAVFFIETPPMDEHLAQFAASCVLSKGHQVPRVYRLRVRLD